MAIIGFNFTKIDANKTGGVSGKVNISNNVMITDAKQIEINLGQKGAGILVKFKYVCSYEPNIGKINLEGDIVFMEPEAVVKASIDSWTKNKTLDKEISKAVLTNALNRGTVEAIILSKELGLPAPIPMPKLGAEPAAQPAKAEAKKK